MIKDFATRFPNVNLEYIKVIGSIVLAMQDTKADQGSTIPEFPSYLDRFMSILNITRLNPGACMELLYPFPYLYNADDQMNTVIQSVFTKFGIKSNFKSINLPFTYTSITGINKPTKRVTFTNHLTITVPSGLSQSSPTPSFIETSYHRNLLTLLLLSHSSSDFILLGPKGSGKSIITKHFASLLGYKIEYIPLYKDLSFRDLVQRRGTSSNGDSIWIDSGLIRAALNGYLAILDPMDVLSNDTLTALGRVVRRDVGLPDGRVLVSRDKYEAMQRKFGWSRDEMERRGVLMIHDGFRVVGLGRLGNWVKAEVNSLFSFVPLKPMTIDEEGVVMRELFPGLEKSVVDKLTRLTSSLRGEKDEALKELASNFSTRQLLRIARRLSLFPKEDLYGTISKISLSPFLPMLAKDALKSFLNRSGIKPAENDGDLSARVYRKDGVEYFQIGEVEAPIRTDTDPALVPKVLFYQNHKQTLILQEILKDYILGENLLLIGNQGVGKNKIVDYFLEMMKLPREYD